MSFLPPVTGNGKFMPPIKMVIFLGDGKHDMISHNGHTIWVNYNISLP